MTFATEFKNMRTASAGAPKAPETATPATTTPEATPEPEVDHPLKDGHTMSAEPTAPEVTPEAPVIPPPKPETKAKVKIGNKEFESYEEAMAYAEAEVIQAEKDKAYAQGIKDSAKQPEKPAPEPEPDLDEELAQQIFENPKEAIKKLKEQIRKEMSSTVTAAEKAKTDAAERAQKIKEETENFYKNNADLVDWQDEVNLVVQKNWNTLSKLPADKIASETARMARDYVESVRVKALPKQELPSKIVNGPSSSNPTTTTTKPATENKVSFVAQVRSTNKRTVTQNEA